MKLTWGKFRFISICLILLCAQMSFAKITVQGTVKNEFGNPLIGVLVSANGTSLQTYTDPNGKFSLDTEPRGTLIFSHPGYNLKKEVNINGKKSIDVTMQGDSEMYGRVRPENSMPFRFSGIPGLSANALQAAKMLDKGNLSKNDIEKAVDLIRKNESAVQSLVDSIRMDAWTNSGYDLTGGDYFMLCNYFYRPADLYLLGLIASNLNSGFYYYNKDKYDKIYYDPTGKYPELEYYNDWLYIESILIPEMVAMGIDDFDFYFIDDSDPNAEMKREYLKIKEAIDQKSIYDNRPSLSEWARTEGIYYMENASKRGYEPAKGRLARLYSTKREDGDARSKAVGYYNDALKGGFIDADTYAGLGYEYILGTNYPRNLKKAAEFLNSAIEMGDNSEPTFYCLGYCYEKGGDGLERNVKKAVELYSKIAGSSYGFDNLAGAKGLYSTALRLAVLYYTNEEVRNYDKAFQWLKYVADHKESAYFYGDFDLKKLEKIAFRFLSACYRFGRGTMPDEDKADYYLELADIHEDIDLGSVLDSLNLSLN